MLEERINTFHRMKEQGIRLGLQSLQYTTGLRDFGGLRDLGGLRARGGVAGASRVKPASSMST